MAVAGVERTVVEPGAAHGRRAAVIAVGSELLVPWRSETNSQAIAEALNGAGIEVALKLVVPDVHAEIAAACRHAMARASLVIVTGGLGPTDDDLTRDAVAAVLGRPLREEPDVLAAIRARFENRGMRMPDNNRRQAQVPEGAQVIPNANGTAPGLWLATPVHGVLLLPGPPREMRPMLAHALARWIEPRWGGARLRRRVVRVAGRTESRVEELAQPLYARWRRAAIPIETTILAGPGVVELHLSARAEDIGAAERALDSAVDQLVERLGADVVSVDGRSLEQAVGDALRARGWRLAVAESCTGGLTASRLTDVAGSSEYVEGGVVAYSNRAKVELLGVPGALLAAHGAVSAPAAAALAEGARVRLGADLGVGITGIAGPGGGSSDKPVGLVFIALAGADGTQVRACRFAGERATIKAFASATALDLVRRHVAGVPADIDWLVR